MAKINDLLVLNLQDNIKSVIDLEDQSHKEIQEEIESYILTEGIAKLLYKFIDVYKANNSQTGCWISGFYGSGKSYFGKMLGYILDNPVINGTHARDRFILQLKGLRDAGLLENAIRGLDSVNSKVIFMDIAKQNTENGLAFTIFSNFLKSLGFRTDIFGFFEYDLFIEGKIDQLKFIVKDKYGKKWSEVKKSKSSVSKAMRQAFLEMGNSEADFNNTIDLFNNSIKSFSANSLKDELKRYLDKFPDQILVFFLDEASEAVSQKKFTLLDLEGISESLSSIQSKVWTVAIAQEKLDDVINNNNYNRNELIKVTDRFFHKFPIESTEVDVIIRNRLLQKNAYGIDLLNEYFKQHDGLVSEATNLSSSFPTKTKNCQEFTNYYPFHRYQFDVLQRFLFSSNALVASQIAARGMIITTFDVLKKQMPGKDIYDFVTAYALCSEAQTAPKVELVTKYETARKILEKSKIPVDGEHLLKTIHFFAESEIVAPTVENITKAYIADLDAYYSMKPEIERALNLLVESKVLLLSNNQYKITSDLEGKLLEEMKDYDVALQTKRHSLIKFLKSYKTFYPVSVFSLGGDPFRFSVVSNLEDELAEKGSKFMTIKAYSIYNVNEDRQDTIDQVKIQTQSQKSLITLIPQNKDFNLIDKLIDEVLRYSYMEEKYEAERDSQKKQIIKSFAIIREEKEKILRSKIENAYFNGTLIYMYDEFLLNENNFKSQIADVQKRLLKNIFTKRLPSQLSESFVPNIFNKKKTDLHRLFSGDEFTFFDSKGNFVGDSLPLIEEINAKISSTFVDGKTLEQDFAAPPWGYQYGSIVCALAVLFRAGKLTIRYNGTNYYSHSETEVHNAFTNTTKFKSASFKAITMSLSTSDKKIALESLMKINAKGILDYKIDFSISDFDLASTIRDLAEHFVTTIKTLEDTIDSFDQLFNNIVQKKDFFLSYTSKLNDSNYIDLVKNYIANKDIFHNNLKTVLSTQKFIRQNLSKVKQYDEFVDSVVSELNKSDITDKDISDKYEKFIKLYNEDIVSNFTELSQLAQSIKDSYFTLMNNASREMSVKHEALLKKVEDAINLLGSYPAELNIANADKLNALKDYCTKRIVSEPSLGFSVKCSNSGYTLSNIYSFIKLAPNKETELTIIKNSFVSKAPEPHAPEIKKPIKINLKIEKKVMSVSEYSAILSNQFMKLSNIDPNVEIELEIEQ